MGEQGTSLSLMFKSLFLYPKAATSYFHTQAMPLVFIIYVITVIYF